MLSARTIPFYGLALLLFSACSEQDTTAPQTISSPVEEVAVNPAAEGFNADASDPFAIALADEVMEAMGGRKAFDESRYFAWTFFGARRLWWDKLENRVRIEMQDQALTMVLDMDSGEGTMWEDSVAYSNPDSLSYYLDIAHQIWVNDAYWLAMPFKLKDSGVTLGYEGLDTITVGEATGQNAHLLSLTFDAVGYTPSNKYVVYVPETGDKLIRQWDFYTQASDDLARFSTPWDGYERHGGLLLSSNRGERGLTDIEVLDSLPDTWFTELNPAL